MSTKLNQPARKPEHLSYDGQKLNWTVEVFLMSDYEAHVLEVIKQVPEVTLKIVAGHLQDMRRIS